MLHDVTVHSCLRQLVPSSGSQRKKPRLVRGFFLCFLGQGLSLSDILARLAEHMIEFLLETRIVGLPTIGHMVELAKHSPIFSGSNQ